MATLLLALRNVLRNRRRTLATVIALAIGLAALNLFGGYIANVYWGLRAQAVSGERLGHLTIYKQGMLTEGKLRPKKYMFDREQARKVEDIVRGTPGVRLISPRLSVSGIASNGRASTIFIGEGVAGEHADILRGDLPEGIGGRLDAGVSNGVALSSELAKLLHLKLHDTLALLVATIDGQANALDAEIVDIFNTGNSGTNDKYLVAPFAYAQKLFDTESVERYVVLLDDVANTDVMREVLATRLQQAGFEVEIKTWYELSSFYMQVRNLFNMIFSFIASIVFVVAVMGIASAMAMTVLERTREIGTLRAIGMKPGGVLRLFGAEGAWLATLGVVLGLVLTAVVAALVNGAGISYVPPNSSNPVALQVDLDWPRMAAVGAAMVAVALAASLLPAWGASRKEVVEALAHT